MTKVLQKQINRMMGVIIGKVLFLIKEIIYFHYLVKVRIFKYVEIFFSLFEPS